MRNKLDKQQFRLQTTSYDQAWKIYERLYNDNEEILAMLGVLSKQMLKIDKKLNKLISLKKEVEKPQEI